MNTRILSLSYSEREDRLSIIVEAQTGDKKAVLLTRRLTGLLVQKVAAMLERSSTMATRAPADQREDVVLLEHENAIRTIGKLHASEESPRLTGFSERSYQETTSSPKLPSILATELAVNKHPSYFEIVFGAAEAGALLRLNIGCDELHRMLNMLSTLCKAADWRIDIKSRWLQSARGHIIN